MSLIPIILYFVGVIGILASIALIAISIKKNAKPSLITISIIVTLSLILLSSGTIFMLKNKSTLPIENIVVDDISETIEKKSHSYEELSFIHKFNDTSDHSQQHTTMTIDNNSDSVFSGYVDLNFLDSNNKLTDSLTIPIKNLMPNSSHSSSAIVSNDALNVTYNFSGSFNENINSDDIQYKINKITFGNNAFRFDVYTNNTSKENLEAICSEFSKEYTQNLCDGFLIYFYPDNKSDSQNFNDAIADYHSNNLKNSSKLIIY